MPIVITADADVVEVRDGSYCREMSAASARRLAQTLSQWADWAEALAVSRAAEAPRHRQQPAAAARDQVTDAVVKQAARLRKDGWKWYPNVNDRNVGFWGRFNGRFVKSETTTFATATAELYAREYAAAPQ